jgi:uncharacterized OsmC-like protein
MGCVTTYYKGGMLFESEVGKHRMLVDGPATWGGQDRGPMPPEVFMASIGSCVGVLVAHFCDTHNLDATDMVVTVNYDKADKPTRFTNIVVDVKMPHAVCGDECTRNALKLVAEHCPVHETILTVENIRFNFETA